MLIVFSLSALAACSGDNTEVHDLEYEIERLRNEIENMEREAVEPEVIITSLENATDVPENTNEVAHVLLDCTGDCIELELPELWAEISGETSFTLAYNTQQNIVDTQIRVFENGNANVRLLPDGSFMANLFHNTTITGTYTEMTDGRETAVLFTYSGINNHSRGVSSFEQTNPVTVVGGIANGILTIPEDWDDGHNHGMDFTFTAYPMVFIGENDQRITLHADNTFEAILANDVMIIGFFGMRAASITFVPGSPTFDRNGVPIGTFLSAELRTCGGDSADNLAQGNDDDCEYVDYDIDGYDVDPEQDVASTPAENPAPTPTPTETPTPTPDDDPEYTQTPVEAGPTPTPAPVDDTTPAETGDDEEDNGSLAWCDECEEWH